MSVEHCADNSCEEMMHWLKQNPSALDVNAIHAMLDGRSQDVNQHVNQEPPRDAMIYQNCHNVNDVSAAKCPVVPENIDMFIKENIGAVNSSGDVILSYACSFCNKEYKRKKFLVKHVQTCYASYLGKTATPSRSKRKINSCYYGSAVPTSRCILNQVQEYSFKMKQFQHQQLQQAHDHNQHQWYGQMQFPTQVQGSSHIQQIPFQAERQQFLTPNTQHYPVPNMQQFPVHMQRFPAPMQQLHPMKQFPASVQQFHFPMHQMPTANKQFPIPKHLSPDQMHITTQAHLSPAHMQRSPQVILSPSETVSSPTGQNLSTPTHIQQSQFQSSPVQTVPQVQRSPAQMQPSPDQFRAFPAQAQTRPFPAQIHPSVVQVQPAPAQNHTSPIGMQRLHAQIQQQLSSQRQQSLLPVERPDNGTQFYSSAAESQQLSYFELPPQLGFEDLID